MEHFVTLFDRNFLPQGLTLHLSMQEHIKSFKLWIICLDDKTYDVLHQIKLPNTSLLRFSQLETEKLKKIKSERSNREYCWTLTPFAPKFVFETDPTVKRVTYLDADMFFRRDPSPIFNEFDKSNKAILITDHAYAKEHDQSKTSGQFCVQFIIFNQYEGEEVRQWWEDRCIEWCFMRFEDGKFGDQKYLEQWPILFPDKVMISKNIDYFQAPWNSTRFHYQDSICWHFHGLRTIKIFGKIKVYLGDYNLPIAVKEYIYRSYIKYFKASCTLLSEYGIAIPVQHVLSRKRIIQFILRQLDFFKTRLADPNIYNLSEIALTPIQKITVITVCKNAKKYIEETMESVLSQSAFRTSKVRLEYLIFDGNSDDGTLKTIEAVASRYSNQHDIKIISEADNGLYDGLAKAMKVASGDLMGYLNAGDYLHPCAFDILIDFFNQYPSTSWVTGLNVIYNDYSQVVSVSLPYRYRRSAIQKGLHGKFLPIIQQESTFWRRNLNQTIDLNFLSKLKYAGDAYIWKCFSSQATLFILQAYLGGFRIHHGQISSNMQDYYKEQRQFSDRAYIWDLGLALIDKCIIHLPYTIKKLLNPHGLLSFHHQTGKWK